MVSQQFPVGSNGNVNGTWTLVVEDTVQGISGRLLDWELLFGTSVQHPDSPSSIHFCEPTARLAVEVEPGVPLVEQDFGAYRNATVEGWKFADLNGDGVWQRLSTVPPIFDTPAENAAASTSFDVSPFNPEPGLGGVTIYLDLNNNQQFDRQEPSAVTEFDNPATDQNEAGFFQLRDLPPNAMDSDLVVREIVPNAHIQTTPDPEGANSGGIPLGELASGETRGGFLFGNQPVAEVHGTKFNDLNGDGIRNVDEPGIGGVTIYADLNNDGVFQDGSNEETPEPFVVTSFDDPLTEVDEAGDYWLTFVDSGDYVIREVSPEGQRPTTPAIVDFYVNEFDVEPGLEWSDSAVDQSPSGENFLGQFESETVSLQLDELPIHEYVRVTADLTIHGPWDGNSEEVLDRFSISTSDGNVGSSSSSILSTTFANDEGDEQNYPAAVSNFTHDATAGAVEVNSLGFVADSIYRVEFVVPHDLTNLQVDFTADGIDGYVGGDDHVFTFGHLAGDCNGDFVVDGIDEEAFQQTLLLTAGDEGFNPCFDFDSDGDVDFLDQFVFVEQFGLSLGDRIGDALPIGSINPVAGAPFVIDAGYDPNTSQVFVRFSEDVSASLNTGDLVVNNLSNGESLELEYVQYDSESDTAYWDASGLNDAHFDVTLVADGITNSKGVTLNGNTNTNDETWGLDNVRVDLLGVGHEVNTQTGQSIGFVNFGNQDVGGEVRGIVWQDFNSDGIRDDGSESGQPDLGIDGWTVELVSETTGEIFVTTTESIDLNNDGIIDPFTEQGVYEFQSFEPGNYTVRIVDPFSTQTFPASPFTDYYVTVSADQVIGELDFGVTEVEAEPDEGALLGPLGPTGPQTFVVTTTSDLVDATDGVLSLREAILEANSNPGQDNIHFNISGLGPYTIQPLSALPSVTDSVVIDGSTQPGFMDNPIIELNGSLTTGQFDSGLVLRSSNNLIRGLSITQWLNHGILITGNDNLIQSNFFGVNPSGSESGNYWQGILVRNGENNQIGGLSPAARNLISGNLQSGIWLDTASFQTLIVGNFIGTDISGENKLGNRNNGIVDQGSRNVIGGATGGAGNVISGNGIFGISSGGTSSTIQGNWIGTDSSGTIPIGNGNNGIAFTPFPIPTDNLVINNLVTNNGRVGISVNEGTGNELIANSIFNNASIGIDLGNNGVTLNDPFDSDNGENDLQNYPIINDSRVAAGSLHIDGELNSAPNSTYHIEFFANQEPDPSGHGEGELFIGSTSVTTDAAGNVAFQANADLPSFGTAFITATATDLEGNTSEFSLAFEANLIGSIHGQKWNDVDGNGIRDEDEEGLDGWEIQVIDVHSGEVIAQQTTHSFDTNTNGTIEPGERGQYWIQVPNGCYHVQEVNQHGWQQTYPLDENLQSGENNPSTGDVNPNEISHTLCTDEMVTEQVSITLPEDGSVVPAVDVLLLFDDTGSFSSVAETIQDEFTQIVDSLQTNLPSVDFGFGVAKFEDFGDGSTVPSNGRHLPFILNQPIITPKTEGFSAAIESALARNAPSSGNDTPESGIEALFQAAIGNGYDSDNNGSVLDNGDACSLGGTNPQTNPINGDVPNFGSCSPGAGVLPAEGTLGGAGIS